MSRLNPQRERIPGREPERISVAHVTANFFNVIGLPPQIGRTFTEDEDRPGAPALVVISDRLWDRAFQRDPLIVGRPMIFHNTPITVIGVMPPEMDSPQGVDAWFQSCGAPTFPDGNPRITRFFTAGPAEGCVTVEQARAEINGIAARLEKLYPATNPRGAEVRPLPIIFG